MSIEFENKKLSSNDEDSKFQYFDNNFIDNDKLMMLMREFPMALERFFIDNDEELPKVKILPSVDQSVDGIIENDNNIATKIYYGDNSIWLLISGIFCCQDVVEEDIIIEKVNNNNNEINNDNINSSYSNSSRSVTISIKSSKKRNKIPLATDSLLDGLWLSSKESEMKRQSLVDLLKSKVVIIDNDMEKFSKDLCEESRRLFKLYLGIQRFDGLNFNWIWKVDKNGIIVHTASVEGSNWFAIKSDSVIKADKYAICNLLVDDERSAEYDKSVDGHEVIYRLDDKSCIRRYWYKAVWPYAVRDIVIMTCWTENEEDGSILISSISPPTNFYPANECKNKKDSVRAVVMSSGALIRPLDKSVGGGCAVTFLTHCDVGGSVPSSLLNYYSTGVPVEFITNIKNILSK